MTTSKKVETWIVLVHVTKSGGVELQFSSFQNSAIDGGQWARSSCFTLGKRASSDRWVGAGWVPDSDCFVEVKFIFLFPGTEPRFFGYHYKTNSSHEAMRIVLCHVATAYWSMVTKFVKTQRFLAK